MHEIHLNTQWNKDCAKNFVGSVKSCLSIFEKHFGECVKKRDKAEIGVAEGALGVSQGIFCSHGATGVRLPCPLLFQQCIWSCLWRVLSKCLKTK